MKNIGKKIIVCIIVVGIVFSVAILGNSLFGNPVSKHLAKNTALEYIEENYPESDCRIEDVFFDSKYGDYQVHIISTTDENIDFSLYISQSGELNLIEYWKNPTSTEESATPLTEDEIKELFLNAHKLYVDWLSPAVKYLNIDWDKTTTIDGVEYFEVVSNEIASVDTLKKEFSKYFSEEIIKENIDRYYVMHNGKMYGNTILAEGGDITWGNHKIIVKTNTDTECVFTVISTFEDTERELDYRLKVVEGEWKFTDVFYCVSFEELVLE